LELCATRSDGESPDWSLIARQALDPSGLDDLCSGVITETSAAAKRTLPILLSGLRTPAEAGSRVEDELSKADEAGAHLVTVLDQDYPSNLRLIPNLPPFLFCLGELHDDDARSLAVVGTRSATPDGVMRAGRMSTLLAQKGITVVSGLARGIDTAAHRAALDAGARTIAVMGTGITRRYPAENADLATEITGSGALVSQFWPSTPPGRYTFPRRNVVTSGISQGTVVIEASSTSGAKMQARLALEHGKKVFLIRSLVMTQPWAQDYVDRRGAIAVADVDEVSRQVAEPDRIHRAAQQNQQLTLSFM
jgi:DNA processing protein